MTDNDKAKDPFNPEHLASSTGAEPGQADKIPPSGESRRVKLLVFDMGHVFVDFDWNEVCAGFCRLSARSRDELNLAFKRVAALGYEKGHIGTDEFVAALARELGCEISREKFEELWNHSFVENAEMAELLGVLKEQVPLYLLSNTNEVHYDFLESSFQVSRHFTEVILSYVVGSAKPDAEIYKHVLDRSGLAGDECLFVDDLAINVHAANRHHGMNVIQFTGAAELKGKLAELGFRTQR